MSFNSRVIVALVFAVLGLLALYVLPEPTQRSALQWLHTVFTVSMTDGQQPELIQAD